MIIEQSISGPLVFLFFKAMLDLITFKYFYTWYFTSFNRITDIQPNHEKIAMNDMTF